MSKLRIIITRITAMLCIAAVLVTVLPVGETVEAATKVSASEKTKVKKTIEPIDYYLCQLVFMKTSPTSFTFKFDNKRKTDMAIHCLPYDKVELENAWDNFEKYSWYGGGYKYSKKTKKLIKQRGKQLFGNSFKLSVTKYNEKGLFFYPLTYDKKYIALNCCDWGDTGEELVYKNISKISGGYLVKLKVTETYEGKQTGNSGSFTVKLKKQGKSLIISDIRM